MIYQVHFTLAMELIALCLATFVLLWSVQHAGRLLKVVGVLSGLFGWLSALVLLGSTLFFLYFPPNSHLPAEAPKPKLQMELPTSSPSKGGIVKPAELNDAPKTIKAQGIELPTITIPKKNAD